MTSKLIELKSGVMMPQEKWNLLTKVAGLHGWGLTYDIGHDLDEDEAIIALLYFSVDD